MKAEYYLQACIVGIAAGFFIGLMLIAVSYLLPSKYPDTPFEATYIVTIAFTTLSLTMAVVVGVLWIIRNWSTP